MRQVDTVPTTEPRVFTGRHMWILMIGFFGVVFAVNAGLAVLSANTWTGLVVENSYVASQEFQEKLDALHAQQTLGWESTFTYASGGARLVVRDAAGSPIDLGEVTLQINRPIGGKDDKLLKLEKSTDGTYVANFDLGYGVWDAMVSAQTATGPFELHERFAVGAD